VLCLLLLCCTDVVGEFGQSKKIDLQERRGNQHRMNNRFLSMAPEETAYVEEVFLHLLF